MIPMTTSRLLLIALPLALSISRVAPVTAQRAPASDSALPAVPIPPTLKVFDPSYIDKSANACHDFFSFANGAWVKRDTIPAAFSSSGVAKDMQDRNEIVARSVLDEAMAVRHTKPKTSTEAKLGTYYASCMDSARADKEGVSPIKPQLDRIAAFQSRQALMNEIAALQTDGVNILFNFFPAADPKDAAHYIAWASQGGLGMPDRDYYTKTAPASDSLRRKYLAHVARALTLAGEPSSAAEADAPRVMAFETELAKASMTRVERRDPNATYHKTSVNDLNGLAPAIDWPVYFRTVGLTTPVAFINVAQPDFMKRASSLLTTLPMEDWRAYLRYHLVSAASPWLSTPFASEAFAYSSLYSGAKQMLPRWKRCLRETDGQLGEALGEAYVAKTFSPEAKAQAKQVIDDICASFRDRLLKLRWMSDSTRQYALAKLVAVREKVGYPDNWRDYSKLEVVDGAFAPNVFSANAFEWQRVANRPGQPVDLTDRASARSSTAIPRNRDSSLPTRSHGASTRGPNSFARA